MKEWRTISETVMFDAQPYVRVTKQAVEIGDGRIIEDFYQVRLSPFVITVPVLENGRVLMIRQYKHGPGRVSLTFPAGFREEGEVPLAACSRELLEETGLVAHEAEHLGEFVDNGNQGGSVGNYFVHRGCRRVREPASGDLEEMELVEMGVGEVDGAVFDGGIAIAHHAAVWSLARLKGL
ncbi:MAG: NUDIX hydrolase [Pseudomonadota bacterium]